MFDDGIAERVVGQYPLSVATSLALEGANGVYPEREETPPPILKYDELWVNLRTLFRNFIGSLDKTTASLIGGYESAEVIAEEMEMIPTVLQESNPNCKVHFYVSNYERMEQKYPRAVIRRDTTPKQRVFTATQDDCIRKLLEHHKGQPNLSVFDRKLKHPSSVHSKVLMITHYAYDLLSAKEFKELALLESHTGAIKPKALWYTKYNQGKELVMIPFREDLLQVFGDAETFSPMDIRLRKEILEVANKYNWSQITTLDRIRLTIESMPNKFYVDILKEILTSQ
jgi:hypothetical protein